MCGLKSLFALLGVLAFLMAAAGSGCGGGEPWESICIGDTLFGARPDEEGQQALERLKALGLIWSAEPVEEFVERCACGCSPEMDACAPCHHEEDRGRSLPGG